MGLPWLAGLLLWAGTGWAMAVETALPAAQSGTAFTAQQNVQQHNATQAVIGHPCGRKSIAQLNRRAEPFHEPIHTHARQYGVESALVKAVITIESCYNDRALSPKGAQGLMQLIPATAERFGVSDAFDSAQNVRGGTRYLSWLSKRFGGDLQKVLAAYNAGEGKVDLYDGIPPYRETRNYVRDVLAVYKKFKQSETPALPAATASAQTQSRPAPPVVQQAVLRRPVNPPPQPQAVQLEAQIVIGGVSRSVSPPAVAATPPRPAAQPQPARQVIPASAPPPPPAQNQPQRVRQTYTPFKPGRAGWQANKAMAPQLYKR
ncbi:MAG: lytic transglycosylase domain-containing protein [Thiolinea sp.]